MRHELEKDARQNERKREMKRLRDSSIWYFFS